MVREISIGVSSLTSTICLRSDASSFRTAERLCIYRALGLHHKIMVFWNGFFQLKQSETKNRKTVCSLDERRVKPILTLLCYDEDQFSADDLLGRLDLDLCRLLKGTSTPEKCTLKMVQNRQWPTTNLFKARKVRGWWPFVSADRSELTVRIIFA